MDRFGHDARQRQSRWSLIGLSVCLTLSLMMNLGQLMARPEPVTVLLPTSQSGSYTVQGSRFDERLLADSAAEVSHIFFNVTPETIGWRRETLLAWTHPSARQEILDQIQSEAETIKRKSLSVAFAVQESELERTSRDMAVVRVEGVLTRWVADRRISSEPTRVTIRFERDDRGAALLSGITWKEGNHD